MNLAWLSVMLTPLILLFAYLMFGAVSGARAGEDADVIKLVSPNGGETWAAGSRHYIRWESSQKDGSQTPVAEYTIDNGKHWMKVPAIAAGAGYLLWPLPNQSAHQCRVRVRDQRSGASAESRAEFAIVPSQAIAGYYWEQVTPQAPFAARDGAGALVFKERMWLLGGWHPTDKRHFPRITNNEVWSSADGTTWDLVKPNTFVDRNFDPAGDWEGRHTAGYAVYRNKMWIVGGDANQGHYQFDVWNSADGKSWTRVNKGRDVPWGPRALHYTVVFKDRIWVMGGQTMPEFAPAKEKFYRDIWNTTDGVNWQKISPQGPYWPARGMIGGSVVFDDRIWILGGGTYDTPTTPERNYYNDVWSSADGVRWQCHAEMAPWAPRQYHEVAVFDDRMWVLEGYNEANRKDVWYSSDGANWYPLPNTPWDARHAASIYVHDNALWVVAGNNLAPDVWKLQRRQSGADPAGAEDTPVVAGMLTNVALGLKGLGDKPAHVYDAKNPDRSPYRLNLYNGRTVLTPIFDTTFGLNFYGLRGENVYAQLAMDAAGDIRFDKWVDGGDGLVIAVDNDVAPPTVIVQKRGEE